MASKPISKGQLVAVTPKNGNGKRSIDDPIGVVTKKRKRQQDEDGNDVFLTQDSGAPVQRLCTARLRIQTCIGVARSFGRTCTKLERQKNLKDSTPPNIGIHLAVAIFHTSMVTSTHHSDLRPVVERAVDSISYSPGNETIARPSEKLSVYYHYNKRCLCFSSIPCLLVWSKIYRLGHGDSCSSRRATIWSLGIAHYCTIHYGWIGQNEWFARHGD